MKMVDLRKASEHPLTTDQAVVVQKLAPFCAELVEDPAEVALLLRAGDPGIFAKCLAGDEAANQVMQLLRSDWALWEKVQHMTGASVRKMCARSSFQLMVVQKVLLIAACSSFGVCLVWGVERPSVCF